MECAGINATFHASCISYCKEISKKVQERRLKWFEHVMRREVHYIGRRAMEIKLQGRGKRRRLMTIWLDKVRDDRPPIR